MVSNYRARSFTLKTNIIIIIIVLLIKKLRKKLRNILIQNYFFCQAQHIYQTCIQGTKNQLLYYKPEKMVSLSTIPKALNNQSNNFFFIFQYITMQKERVIARATPIFCFVIFVIQRKKKIAIYKTRKYNHDF